jgi:hypothetical protein
MEEKLKKLYQEIEDRLLNILSAGHNFGKECDCEPDAEYFLYVDIDLVVTPYCLSCGGFRQQKEPEISKDNEIRGIPQIRRMRNQNNNLSYKKLSRIKTKDL